MTKEVWRHDHERAYFPGEQKPMTYAPGEEGPMTDDDKAGIITNNSFVFTISREQAIAEGLVEPTPEEWAAMQDDRRRFRRHQRDQWAQWLKTKELLDSVTEPMARMVLDLHTPEDDVCGLVCKGCDYEGFEGEPPAYPCRTVQLIAAHQQIDLPTYIGSKPPDDDSDLDQPWRKREPIHTLFPSAFTNLSMIDYGKLKDDDMEDKR